MPTTPTLFCDDGSEIELPFRWEICSHCRGDGKSSAYLGAYTREDMDEAGPEFMEDYMAGRYDRACDHCGGSGKVKVVDHKRVTKDHLAEWRSQQDAEAAVEAEDRAERRYFCGLERGY